MTLEEMRRLDAQKTYKELEEAKQYIKRLEEDLMDAKNKHAAMVADVVLYEDRGERICCCGMRRR